MVLRDRDEITSKDIKPERQVIANLFYNSRVDIHHTPVIVFSMTWGLILFVLTSPFDNMHTLHASVYLSMWLYLVLIE